MFQSVHGVVGFDVILAFCRFYNIFYRSLFILLLGFKSYNNSAPGEVQTYNYDSMEAASFPHRFQISSTLKFIGRQCFYAVRIYNVIYIYIYI